MRKKGFTYIELMIAISIFALLILMVMKINITSQSNLNKQMNSQKMMFVAQKQMERFKTTVSNNSTLSNIGSYENGFQEDDSGYYIVVNGNNLVTNNSNVYLVTVWVRKSPNDSSNEIKLQSHVLKD